MFLSILLWKWIKNKINIYKTGIVRKMTVPDSESSRQSNTLKPPGSPCKPSLRFFLSEIKQQLLEYTRLLLEKHAGGIFYAWVRCLGNASWHSLHASRCCRWRVGSWDRIGRWQIRRQEICHRGEAEILFLLISRLPNSVTLQQSGALGTKLNLSGDKCLSLGSLFSI